MNHVTKKELHDLIERMPDDFDLEDVQYRLFVLQKLERAEEQLKQGCETTSLAEMRKLAQQWHGEIQKTTE